MELFGRVRARKQSSRTKHRAGQLSTRIVRRKPTKRTKLEYRSALAALVETMRNDHRPNVRHESAVALSSIGDERALPELEKAIGDKDEDVSNSALIAFEYLSHLSQMNRATPEAAKPRSRL